jgi:mannitol-specific phosphotransferase system IIBC component
MCPKKDKSKRVPMKKKSQKRKKKKPRSTKPKPKTRKSTKTKKRQKKNIQKFISLLNCKLQLGSSAMGRQLGLLRGRK